MCIRSSDTSLSATSFAICLLVTAFYWPISSVHAADLKSQPTEVELLEVLQSGSSAEKALACKQLALHGGKNACPVLATLLADKQLASWARIALEAIPDPAADEALRNSMLSLQGDLAIGVINSIGTRRDFAAVELLTKRVDDTDTEVASAAAVALGRIGNSSAIASLQAAFAGTSGDVRSAVAEGYLICADRLIAEGNSEEAAKIYDAVRVASVPKPRQLEATRGAILSRGNDGIPLLVEQLRSPDRQHFQIGLTTIREHQSEDVVETVSLELSQVPPDRAAMILHALADRVDSKVPRAVVVAANSGDARFRKAAIEFIGRRGNESHLEMLLEIAAESDELAPACMDALAILPGNKVDEAIVTKLANAQDQRLPVLIGAIGRRRIVAIPELRKLLDHPAPSIRAVTLAALGESVGAQDLKVLIREVISPRVQADAEPAALALQVAATRMPDRELCATDIASSIPAASMAAKVRLLNVLGAVGGPTALEAISSVMQQDSDELRDVGSRLLGGWMSSDAAPVLLEQAKSTTATKYKIRALRGYIRIARQFQMPIAERADMCRNAMSVAERVDEQRLVLAVLERYPDIETLKIAATAARTPGVQQDAESTALRIAGQLGPTPEAKAIVSELGIEKPRTP